MRRLASILSLKPVYRWRTMTASASEESVTSGPVKVRPESRTHVSSLDGGDSVFRKSQSVVKKSKQ